MCCGPGDGVNMESGVQRWGLTQLFGTRVCDDCQGFWVAVAVGFEVQRCKES